MKPWFSLLLLSAMYAQPAFHGHELLGRITNNSVTINVAPSTALEFYFEYGTTPGVYGARTATAATAASAPLHTLIDKLQADTRYYYRLRYREPGAAAFLEGPERTFRTQRPRGATFTFAIQADPHMDENSDAEVYRTTLRNQLAAGLDFMIDLGDVTMADKLQPVTENGVRDRTRLMRSFYDISSHSVPLFLVLGNHEGEWGRNLNGTPNNVAVWNTLLRKQYFANPAPDHFFTGDTKVEPLVGVRESYYAFEWGDALFVALDPYWNRPVAPEAVGDWSLTLGRAQYDWLKKTLETSTATYKFVFAHNLIGGRDLNGPMRGGIETAKYLEWGGFNLDDSWGFSRSRPSWPAPIHQLLVANNVTAFFHGHDHVYAKQELDGVVYMETPQPSARNFNLGNRGIDYSYTNGTVLGGTGYIRVQVSPTEVKAEYVQTWLPTQENAARKNAMIADTWTVRAPKSALELASAASFAGGLAAPSSILSSFGQALGSNSVLVKDAKGVERRAEVLGSAAAQVNFVVPPDTAPGRATVSIGGAEGEIWVGSVAPALFAINAGGSGPAAAVAVHVKADGAQTNEFVFRCGTEPGSCVAAPIDLGPANEQVVLSLYGTGLRNRASIEDVNVLIGGVAAEVLYAGPQGGFAGLDQINVRVPRTLAGRGEVPVVLATGGRAANTVTINIR